MAIDISNRPDRPIRKITFTKREEKIKGISSDILKLVAVLAMVIDHLAWAFVPFGSFPGQVMHIIGRITAPIMCFLIAEGYHKTRNRKNYALRLFIFAVISHIPYTFFRVGEFKLLYQTSIMLPLALGVLSLMIRDDYRLSYGTKSVLTLLICIISVIGDWGATAVIWIQFFSAFYNNRKQQVKYFCIIGGIMIAVNILFSVAGGLWYTHLYKLGIFAAVPLLLNYNGQRKFKSAAVKWSFYVFYPLHMGIIAFIKFVLI